jgi:hypothetical protein
MIGHLVGVAIVFGFLGFCIGLKCSYDRQDKKVDGGADEGNRSDSSGA